MNRGHRHHYPLVSVLIPTFNRSNMLKECLDSILSQTYKHLEVIVINDGSTDETWHIVKSYPDNRIIYIEKPNGGKSTALNTGLQRARGEFVWIMDDDDLALKDALERHLSEFNNDTSIGFTYSSAYFTKTDRRPDPGEKLKLVPAYKSCTDSLLLSFMLAPSTGGGFMWEPGMLVRKSCYDKVGPFDETLFRCQDYEMNLRLCRMFKGARIGRPTFIIRGHSGNRGPGNDRHTEEDRTCKWREYRAVMFRRLYNELPLKEYLDLPNVTTGNPGWEIQAIENRIHVMAKRDLYDLVVRDTYKLAEWARSSPTGIQSELIERIFAIEGMYLLREMQTPAREIRKALRTLLRSSKSMRHFRTRIARSYYWRGCERCRNSSLRDWLLDSLRGIGMLRMNDVFVLIREWLG